MNDNMIIIEDKLETLRYNLNLMQSFAESTARQQQEFNKQYPSMARVHQYSPIAIIQTSLNGFYNAYMQMYLPSTIVATLREETRKMVRALYHYNPSSCRSQVINIIKYHGGGKEADCIPKHIEELDAWIMEAISDNTKMQTQLTETLITKLNEHNTKLDNSKGDQQV